VTAAQAQLQYQMTQTQTHSDRNEFESLKGMRTRDMKISTQPKRPAIIGERKSSKQVLLSETIIRNVKRSKSQSVRMMG
jgi:hypothetical protein